MEHFHTHTKKMKDKNLSLINYPTTTTINSHTGLHSEWGDWIYLAKYVFFCFFFADD